MKKLTKTQVVSRINKHGRWEGYICPSKCSPRNDSSAFNMAMKVTFDKVQLGRGGVDKILNEFSYYNCNSETGNRIHFYEEVDQA